MRKYILGDLEGVLSQWCNEGRASNIPNSGAILKEKASQIGESVKTESFQASNRWLEYFKKRYDLVSRRISCVSQILMYISSVLEHRCV